MLLIFRDVAIDDLNDFKITFLLTYKGVTGELGFQSDSEGKCLLLRLVEDSFWITSNNVQIVDKTNLGIILNQITKKKYGILIHEPNSQFTSLIEELPMYFRKKSMIDLKRRKGINCEDVTMPDWLEMISNLDKLNESIRWLITKCRFVSIWPKYWGAYGEHCFIASQNIEEIIGNKIDGVRLN